MREPIRRGGGAGVLGDSGSGPKALAEDSSTVPGDPKSKRIRASGSGDGKSGGGSEGMSPTDAGSLPGNGGGSRDSGGGGSGSGRPSGSGESAASQHKLAGQ